MHGQGTYSFADGRFYNGKWLNDQLVEKIIIAPVTDQLEKFEHKNEL